MNTELSLSNPLWAVVAAIAIIGGWLLTRNKTAPQPEPATSGPLASILGGLSGTRLGGAAALLTMLLNHKQLIAVGLKVWQFARDKMASIKASNEAITPEKLQQMIAEGIAAAKAAEAEAEEPVKK